VVGAHRPPLEARCVPLLRCHYFNRRCYLPGRNNDNDADDDDSSSAAADDDRDRPSAGTPPHCHSDP
jgi:hypothetical protein